MSDRPPLPYGSETPTDQCYSRRYNDSCEQNIISTLDISENNEHWTEDVRQNREIDLATCSLFIQSKRLHLDVKQNRRSRFIKMTEVSGVGEESQIFLDMSTAARLRDCLSDFSHYCASLGSTDSERRPAFDNLRIERISKDKSRYYFDLKKMNGVDSLGSLILKHRVGLVMH
jgi:PurA ssDNA and RNA-binding protein